VVRRGGEIGGLAELLGVTLRDPRVEERLPGVTPQVEGDGQRIGGAEGRRRVGAPEEDLLQLEEIGVGRPEVYGGGGAGDEDPVDEDVVTRFAGVRQGLIEVGQGFPDLAFRDEGGAARTRLLRSPAGRFGTLRPGEAHGEPSGRVEGGAKTCRDISTCSAEE